jgi:hypothetical protein
MPPPTNIPSTDSSGSGDNDRDSASAGARANGGAHIWGVPMGEGGSTGSGSAGSGTSGGGGHVHGGNTVGSIVFFPNKVAYHSLCLSKMH